MVQDELTNKDKIYEVENILFVVSEQIEKEISFIEIDYKKEYWGEDFVITTLF